MQEPEGVPIVVSEAEEISWCAACGLNYAGDDGLCPSCRLWGKATEHDCACDPPCELCNLNRAAKQMAETVARKMDEFFLNDLKGKFDFLTMLLGRKPTSEEMFGA
jgi:hypothetical protein